MCCILFYSFSFLCLKATASHKHIHASLTNCRVFANELWCCTYVDFNHNLFILNCVSYKLETRLVAYLQLNFNNHMLFLKSTESTNEIMEIILKWV